MKKVITIFVILFAISLTMMLPVAKELIFCFKRVDVSVSANEVEANAKEELNLTAKSSILMEAKSGKVLAEDNATAKLAPASMTKVMTMLLVMEDLEKGKLSLDQKTIVSDYAASQEGSECFLDAGHSYTIEELIKSVAVASANDSCVALAEAVSGDEKVFVKEMNRRAKELGMDNTNFVNCTGLDVEGHYSSAYDLCLAIKALSKYSLIAELEKTWMYDMIHKNGRVTGLTNTNRLVRNNPDCFMAKTGHTDNAGYCIVVYGKRGESEMIACVMGVNDSKVRFEEVTRLLNYGFSNYESKVILSKDKPLGEIEVKGGKIKTLPYYAEEDLYGFSRKGEEITPEIKHVLDNDQLKAPIKGGEDIGKVEMYINGVKTAEANLETRDEVEKKAVIDLVKELISYIYG